MRAWLLFVGGCGISTGAAPVGDPAWAPEVACPGGPECADNDGALKVGVAVRSITPACYESWEDRSEPLDWVWQSSTDPFFDCGCDRLCPGDPGYTAADAGEGDGAFQAIWLGGFQNKRPATGVRGADRGMIGEGDDLETRALVIDQGGTRLAIVTMDALGVMHDQVLMIREAVLEAGLGVDHVMVHSSHSHSAPDSLGIYGPSYASSGWNADLADQQQAAVVEAVREAAGALVEVEMSWGQVDATTYWENGVANLISDTRDPVVVDPMVSVVRFAAGAETVATVVHWANHPETIADENTLMTADFVHGVRKVVSEGSRWPGGLTRPGIGGTTLFINGTVGGMMTSLRASVVDPEGNTWRDHSWEKVDAVGQLVGELALDAVAAAVPAEAPKLRFVTEPIDLRIDNTGFQAMFLLDVFAERTTINWDEEVPLSESNKPYLQTEVGVVELGPLQMVWIPGEVFPEAALGGYDGSLTPPGSTILSADNEHPPDLAAAPTGPYLRDRMGGELKWVVSLGNDEIGYLMPAYDYKLAEVGAYVNEAEGDHYEETNSISAETWPALEALSDELIGWLAR
jgi:hypothetical protein